MQNGVTITFLMEQKLLRIDIGQVSLKVGGKTLILKGALFQLRCFDLASGFMRRQS